MKQNILISIFCEDKTGLVASISGLIFDLGGNLCDTNFAVLGTGAEFTAVCEIPETLEIQVLELNLRQLELLSEAEINVSLFSLNTIQRPTGQITHNIRISGGDQPGLIARLSETFVEYEANVVRLSAQNTDQNEYEIRLGVSIPSEKTEACLATISNTAEGLQLRCSYELARDFLE